MKLARGDADLARYREFGSVCFGPVMLEFVRWLAETAAARNVDTLYFLAREGHFLLRAYEKYLTFGVEPGARKIPGRYLLTSRRAIFGAAEKNVASLHVMLDAGVFSGTLRSLVSTRFSDAAAKHVERDGIVKLPRDTKRVLDVLLRMLPELNAAAATERAALRRYLSEVGFLDTPHVGLVDLGYSGSIQRYLHEIAPQRTTGFYFSTTERAKAWQTDLNRACACFGEGCGVHTTLPVYRYSVVLEAWLTSPDPQLVRFADGQPVFAEGSAMQLRFDRLEAISEGVHDYFDDVVRIGGARDDVSWFAQDVMLAALFAERYAEVVRTLSLEDRFCGNQELEIAARIT